MPHAANTNHRQLPLNGIMGGKATRKRYLEKNNDCDTPQSKKPRRAKFPPSATSSASRTMDEILDSREDHAVSKQSKRLQRVSTSKHSEITKHPNLNEQSPVELLVHGRKKRSTAGKSSSNRPFDDRWDRIFDEEEDDSDFVDDTEDSPSEDMNMDMELDDCVEAMAKTPRKKITSKNGRNDLIKEGVQITKVTLPETVRLGSDTKTSLPIAVNQKDYLVDALVQYRLDSTGHEEVLVRWLGFPKRSDHTWEEVEGFRQGCGEDVVDMLRDFLPSARLKYFKTNAYVPISDNFET